MAKTNQTLSRILKIPGMAYEVRVSLPGKETCGSCGARSAIADLARLHKQIVKLNLAFLAVFTEPFFDWVFQNGDGIILPHGALVNPILMD